MNREAKKSPLKKCADIAIFAFNRPIHLAACLESLKSNEMFEISRIWIFIDGPRTKSDQKSIDSCFEIACKLESENYNIEIVKAAKNLGLSKSIIEGINLVFKNSNKVIVIEDDLEVSPFFLDFCNVGLNKYEFDQRVASVHGFSYGFKKPEKQPYFLLGADCWGWATWKDRWQLLEEDSNKLITQISARGLKKKFDLDGVYPYFNMLLRQAQGEVNSWAIRWHASMFLANKLTLYPDQTLVINNGIDGSGTHAAQSKSFNSPFSNRAINFESVEVEESKKAKRKLKRFLKKHYSIRYRYSPIRIVSGIKRRTMNG